MSTAKPSTDDALVELLIEAGVVLGESLDLQSTLERVAGLTVPRLADLCVIDLCEADGSIRRMAVASTDETVAKELGELRERQTLDPNGRHPVAQVIRSGVPARLERMSGDQLRSFATGSEHANFMIKHGYHSAAVAPLLVRRRTLGALSVLRLSSVKPYTPEELQLTLELARRAALAIENARLFSQVRAVEQRLEAILVNLAEAITLTDAEDRIVFANQAAAELLLVENPGALVGRIQEEAMRGLLMLDEDGQEIAVEHMPRRRLFAGEAPQPQLIRSIVRATGEERWLIVKPAPVKDPETSELMFSVNIYENITEVKRTQLAEAFMAEASRILASSMDYRETLPRVARLAVPQIADWCAIDVLSEQGDIERVAMHHRDPTKLALAERMQESYPPSMQEATGVAAVIRRGRSGLSPAITPQTLADHAREPSQLEMLLDLGVSSMIIVPLAAPSRTVGAITLASAESIRRLSERDVALAERLGRRGGTAVESARLYKERTRIANTLQAALLPEVLPEVPGVAIESLYRAAGELNDVGGDFYDVFAYGHGRWLLVIGDVCGKGPRAAGVTALARHTLRTAAALGQTPAGMLEVLHQALRRQPPGADLCTVALVTIEPGSGGLALGVTLAGHPTPLVIDPAGSVRQVGQPGTLLGVIDPIEVHSVDGTLASGETLVLYTDGLPEAGHSGTRLGEGMMHELCSRAPGEPLAELLERLESAAIEHAGGALHDDIALLAVRSSQPSPAAPERARIPALHGGK